MSHCRSPNRRLFLLLSDAVLMKFLGIAIMAILLLPAFASAVPEGVLPSSDYVPAVSENAASYGNGYRYNMNGFIYVHIEGDAYERGYQHGYLLYPEIMDMLYRWSNVIHNCPIVLKYVHLNESSPRYEKISGIWWNYCRNKAMNIFWDKYPAEYKSEIKGIADAVAARGGEMFGEKVTYEDILTLNEMYELMSILVNPVKSIHPLRTLFYDLLGAAPELENKENEFISSLASYPPVHHCDGFIATGDATTNGQVVATDSVWCGGWWYTYYIAQRWNIILDIVPAQGNRIIIGTSPGYIWSDEDYWQNDKGIILIETTCPQGLWKKNGMPLAIRTRMAMQYGENIDDVIRYMRTDSNGVFRGNVIFDLIRDYGSRDMSSYGNLGLNDTNFTLKNMMCFVVGYGDALFAYPMDLLAIFLIVLLLGWMPLGIILVLAYSALWMYFSHLIPVRFILPITLIGINKGGITTMGLKGVRKIEGRENESVSGMLIGFSGIVVNVFLLPKNDREMSAPFFCLGTSIMAYEKVN